MPSKNVQSAGGSSRPTAWQITSGCYGICMAIISVALLFVILWSLHLHPYIEGIGQAYGGRENPFVSFATAMALAGGLLLWLIAMAADGIAFLLLIVWVVIYNNSFKRYVASGVAAAVAVVSVVAFTGTGHVIQLHVGASIFICLLASAFVVWKRAELVESGNLGNWPADNRLLTMYRCYLSMAAFLGLIAFGKSLFGAPPMYVVIDACRVGFFVFAIYSLRDLRAPWLRAFHLSINAAAVIMIMLALVVTIVAAIDPSVFQQFSKFLAPLEFGNVVVFPLYTLIPFEYLGKITPYSPELSHPITQLRIATQVLSLTIAAYWTLKWARQRGAVQHAQVVQI